MKSPQEKEAFRVWVASHQNKDRFPGGLKWLIALNSAPLALLLIYLASSVWLANSNNSDYIILLQWTILAEVVLVPAAIILVTLYATKQWKNLKLLERLICLALIGLHFLTVIPFFILPILMLASSK